MESVVISHLGRRDYRECHQAMQSAVARLRGADHAELWVVEHPPVFTQGQAGRPEHILAPGDIPVVQSDRGGQVTYHGPGQTVIYTLVPLKAFGLNVRALVSLLEEAVIAVLGERGVEAESRADAPGVYVRGAKIASLGLRIRHGVSYHGVALNVAMDLAPFAQINPCGYAGMAVTQVSDEMGIAQDPDALGDAVAQQIAKTLTAQWVAGQAH